MTVGVLGVAVGLLVAVPAAPPSGVTVAARPVASPTTVPSTTTTPGVVVIGGGGGAMGSVPPAKALQAREDRAKRAMRSQKVRSRNMVLFLYSSDEIVVHIVREMGANFMLVGQRLGGGWDTAVIPRNPKAIRQI
jgi:hypothetical protein